MNDQPQLRCIIAGGRDISDMALLESVMQRFLLTEQITEVVCGMADGVDSLGFRWAKARNIPVKEFPAEWKPNGPDGATDHAAGPKRNIRMAEYADALVAIPGKGRGTRHMIEQAMQRDLIVFVHEIVSSNYGELEE